MKRLRINLNRSPDSLSVLGRPVRITDKAPTRPATSNRPQPAFAPAANGSGFAAKPPRSPAPSASAAVPPATAATRSPSQPAMVTSAADQAAAKEIQNLRDLLATAVDGVTQLQQQQRTSLEELQQVAVELSVSAASWLTGVAVDAGLFAVDDLIRMALNRLEADTPVRVRLHPADRTLLKQLLNTPESDAQLQELQCIEDASVPRGSCRVESGRRILVSDMESRLEEIRRLWMENLDVAQIERRGDDSHGRGLRRFPDRRETA